jgi:translation initiation factor 5B
MGSLIYLLVELTQTMLSKRLAHCEELRAQVMEVIIRLPCHATALQ